LRRAKVRIAEVVLQQSAGFHHGSGHGQSCAADERMVGPLPCVRRQKSR
jgi:hypothetical protein